MVEKKTNGGGGTVSWEAEEYAKKEKGVGWYVGLIGVSLGLAALAVILKWWTFLVLVVLSAVALYLYSVRPPRVLHYSLSSKGLLEGETLHNLEEFKSFGVVREGEKCSVVLTPRKRFSPRLTVYFPEESGERIVDFLGARLPMEEVKYDFVDKIVKVLRF